MEFVLAKVVERAKVEDLVDEKKAVVAKSKAKGKSLPKRTSSEAFLPSLWYS